MGQSFLSNYERTGVAENQELLTIDILPGVAN